MFYIIKPNSRCKNRNCTKGVDGGRALFYACLYCTHKQKYRAVACSPECYEEYIKQVAEARSNGAPVEVALPERLDMTQQEVVDLINEPTEAVIKKTKEELADYIEDEEYFNVGGIVEMINEKIRAGTPVRDSEEVKISDY